MGLAEFERVARPLCEFDFGQIQRAEYTENEDNPFSMIFNDLLTMLQPDGMTPLISGNLIRDLMNQIVSRTKARGRLYVGFLYQTLIEQRYTDGLWQLPNDTVACTLQHPTTKYTGEITRQSNDSGAQ